jgi:hypothetical protein
LNYGNCMYSFSSHNIKTKHVRRRGSNPQPPG